MKKFGISFIAVLALAFPAWGQRIEVVKPDRETIIHVETALKHLTILEMDQPVETVAVGSPAFHVEWRGNKVFIEPTEPDVATNLFVWTASGRFNYELDPAGVVPRMIFAIDQPAPDPPTISALAVRPARPDASSLTSMLIAANPIRLIGTMPQDNRVTVYLNDSFARDGELFIRYTVRNETNEVQALGTPQVWSLKAPRYRESLYALSNSQLSPREAARLKCKGKVRLEVERNELKSLRINPGQETAGIVAIQWLGSPAAPKVLRLIFFAGPHAVIDTTLVL